MRFEVVTAIVERIGLVPVRLLWLPCGGGHLLIESCIFEAPLFLESGVIAEFTTDLQNTEMTRLYSVFSYFCRPT